MAQLLKARLPAKNIRMGLGAEISANEIKAMALAIILLMNEK